VCHRDGTSWKRDRVSDKTSRKAKRIREERPVREEPLTVFFGIKRGTAIAKLLFAPAPDPRIKGKLYWRRPARVGLTVKTEKYLPLGIATSRAGVLPSRSN
jgi:hypothetical protein